MADLELQVLNQNGRTVGTVAVAPQTLGTHIRPTLIHRAIVRYGRNQRSGTASTKTRSEVRRGNRKPWPQKGTGRARAGTRRSPLWRGGGVIFGPKPRDYSYRMNRKQRRLAMRSALLWKIADKQVVVVEELELDQPKTKLMVEHLHRLGITGTCLVGLEAVPRNVLLASRNIPGVKVIPAAEFNAYDIVRRNQVLVTRGALEAILAEGTDASRPGDDGTAHAAEPPPPEPAPLSSPPPDAPPEPDATDPEEATPKATPPEGDAPEAETEELS
jgi:large subunit ribosomal protein L4